MIDTGGAATVQSSPLSKDYPRLDRDGGMSDETFTIHTDGAARGNPGPAAWAYIIERPGHPNIEEKGCLGCTTNNVAEYTAVIKALDHALRLGARKAMVYSDSELMIRQMNREYKVKDEKLRPLFEQALDLCHKFEKVTFHHIRREQNRRADQLCTEAFDGETPTARGERQPSVSPARGADTPCSTEKHTLSQPPAVREQALECLRSVAEIWARGNPNDPRPEEVWEQLWSILEEGNVLRPVKKT